MQRKGIKSVIFLLFGLTFIGLALFARFFGLDREAGWSRTRIAMLLLGMSITVSYIFYYRYRDAIFSQVHRVRAYLEGQPATARMVGTQRIARVSHFYHEYRFTFPAILLVILIYIWFVSAGTWTTWISPTRYYADLARGFQRGNLFLPTRVDPHLLQLADPYDPSTRWEVEAPLDITYYEGKYYLYWGPVPALILVGIQSLVHGRVGDLFLVFGFVCGIFLSQFFLIISIWDHFFSALPKWLLFVSILVAGLAGPTAFMLDHVNSARIYEAAITGGQFFLMSGLLLLISTLNGFSSRWRLALMGTLWALAIGTRLTLMVPIGIMVLIVAFWILRSDNKLFSKTTKLISLGLPLALGFVCLGWYNWARFGSVAETGYYFQLAGPHLQKYYGILFQPAYVLQNLYNYLLHPFRTNSQFPFFHPTNGSTEAIFGSYSFPDIYSAQVITGILYLAPFVIFAIIPFGMIVYRHSRSPRSREPAAEDRLDALRGTTLILGTAVVSAFVMLLFFFWAGMRYSEDFVPALMVLSVIGFWQGYQILTQHHKARKAYTVIGIVLAITSVLISLLTALSVNDARLTIIRFFGFP